MGFVIFSTIGQQTLDFPEWRNSGPLPCLSAHCFGGTQEYTCGGVHAGSHSREIGIKGGVGARGVDGTRARN